MTARGAQLVDDVVDALLPSTCIACSSPSSSTLCDRCASAVEGAGDTHDDGFAAAFLFGGPIADAIRAAKFGPDEAVAEALGRLWVERVRAGQATLPDVDAIAFVPAPYRRRLARGFDLPAVLAQSIAAHQRVLVVDALRCTRTDEPLSFGADKQTRSTKVAGRYRARPVKPTRLLLVDDVRTTGATLTEAARVLTAAGHDVVTAALAVAP